MPTVDLRNVNANEVVVGFHATGGVLQSVGLETGEILIGQTDRPPRAGTLGSADGSVDITVGAGGIDLSVDAALRDKTITSVDGSVDLVTGASTVDLSVDPTLWDKAISAPDGSVVVTTGPATVTLAVASSIRDKAIASADQSVAVVTGASVDLSVARPYNFIFNGDAEIWGAGPSAAPTGWTLAGAGATVARTTTAGQFKSGTAAASMTRAGTDCSLYCDVAAVWPPAASWQGLTVTFGAWVRATVASRALVSINDGVGNSNSAFHSGGGGFEFLTVTRTLNAAATSVLCGLVVMTGNTTAQIDGAILVIGATCAGWVPAGWRGRKAILQFSSGAQTLVAIPTYYGAGYASATSDLLCQFLAAPFKGVARNLVAARDSGGGAAIQVTDTLRIVNSANTALAAFIAANSVVGSDTTHEVEIAKGTAICIYSNENQGFRHTATLEYEEIP
jgi:hypothetical protein